MTAESTSVSPSVLIVDDEEAVAYTLGEVLAAEGYHVATATSVPEAFARIEDRTFEAAVLDLKLGDESGLTVLARLRERSPYTATLLLTGFGSMETAVQAMRHGALDYLIKPCDIEELKATLARGIQARRRERRAAESERVRAELERALASAERSRDRFLTIAGHELKTPLAALIGWAQLTQRQLQRGIAEGAVERLDAVVQQAQRLARLVEAMTELVSTRQGRRRLNRSTVDLQAIVLRAVAPFRARPVPHDMITEFPDEPVRVLGDAASLDLVLRCLLDNAVKFSPAGGPVTVRVEAGDGDVRVSVEDRGIGIAPSEIDRIFDRFYQSDGDVMSRRFGGIGAGLYLGRALVEAQGGRLFAESAGPGQGSRFTMTLPLAKR
jgi:signal transduction histidine kinase